jgi:hypothetical protein
VVERVSTSITGEKTTPIELDLMTGSKWNCETVTAATVIDIGTTAVGPPHPAVILHSDAGGGAGCIGHSDCGARAETGIAWPRQQACGMKTASVAAWRQSQAIAVARSERRTSFISISLPHYCFALEIARAIRWSPTTWCRSACTRRYEARPSSCAPGSSLRSYRSGRQEQSRRAQRASPPGELSRFVPSAKSELIRMPRCVSSFSAHSSALSIRPSGAP